MQTVPRRFLSYMYKKRAFCGLQNTPESVFGRGSAGDPAGGAHDAPPDPIVGCRRDTPPHTPLHLALIPPLALAMRLPRDSSYGLIPFSMVMVLVRNQFQIESTAPGSTSCIKARLCSCWWLVCLTQTQQRDNCKPISDRDPMLSVSVTSDHAQLHSSDNNDQCSSMRDKSWLIFVLMLGVLVSWFVPGRGLTIVICPGVEESEKMLPTLPEDNYWNSPQLFIKSRSTTVVWNVGTLKCA